MIEKIVKMIQKIFGDDGFNQQVKAAKNAKDLAARLIMWGLPLILAAMLSKAKFTEVEASAK